MSQERSIPCPSCQTKIPIDTKELLLGGRVDCPNCHVTLSLGNGDGPKMLEKLMDKLRKQPDERTDQ